MKKRFSAEQIIGFLNGATSNILVKERCRKRLKQFEVENTKQQCSPYWIYDRGRINRGNVEAKLTEAVQAA